MRSILASLYLTLCLSVTAAPAATAQKSPFANDRAANAAQADPWWKHAVIYEVYPRSFSTLR